MASTEQLQPITPPQSHYVYAMLSIAMAAMCVGLISSTRAIEVRPALAIAVILIDVGFIIAQHYATFRASTRGALTSVVLLPILIYFGVSAFVSHFAAPVKMTSPMIAGGVLVGIFLLGFILLAIRSNLHWANVIKQARQSEKVVLPVQKLSFTSQERISVIGAISVSLVCWLVVSQTVPANPVFYMKNVNPARARFDAPRTAVYLIVQGLPDETILAEWVDAPKNLDRWLAEQAKRPGVNNFQRHKVVEPIEYRYPNSFLTWGSESTAEQGQRVTWQEGERQYEVLWNDEFEEQFGEILVNYIERKPANKRKIDNELSGWDGV